MLKAVNNYRTITLRLPKTGQLDILARESGRVYSKTVSYIHKIHDKKGIWLSATQMQKIISSDKLHSQTTQAIIQRYFASLKSYFENHKFNPDARPPHKRHKYFCIPFKQSAIKVMDGSIRLSCGSGNQRISIPIPLGKFLTDIRYAEIVWDGEYSLKIVVKIDIPALKNNGKVIAVDPGEIHPLTIWDGEKGTIYNGRLLRSEKQYREKVKAEFATKISRKKNRSLEKTALFKAKRRKLNKLNNRIRDMEHKVTRHFVETCRRDNVSTVVYGDTTHIRQGLDYGNSVNQKLHQWGFDRIRFQVAYKLAEYGIGFMLINERGTSHTCPVCGQHVNPNGRRFKCPYCGFYSHRDVLGAINILSKYQGQVPVVASMAQATGVRFNYHLRCSDSSLRIPRL